MTKEDLAKLLLDMSDELFNDNTDQDSITFTSDLQQDDYTEEDEDEVVFDYTTSETSTDSTILEETGQSSHGVTQDGGISSKLGKIIKFPTREALANEDWSSKSESDKFISVDDAVRQMTERTEQIISDDLFYQQATEDVLKALKAYNTDEQLRNEKKAYNSQKSSRQCNSKSAYKRDTAEVAGKEFKYTGIKEIPKWGIDLQSCMSTDDKALNLDQLTSKITEEFVNYFGGVKHIKTIVVLGYQLIINSVLYVPVLNDTVLSRMPFDSADYVRNGCYAPFFNWGVLRKASHVTLLSFDDMDFVMQYVIPSMGYTRYFNPIKLFDVLPNLQLLDIAGDVVSFPFEDNDTSEEGARNITDEVERYSRFDKVYNAYTSHVSDTLGSVRKWTVSNLVNYANNRGNKGIFSYTAGLAGRTVVSATAGVAELGARSIGGIFRGVGNVFKNAVREVHDKDIKN